ncbi:MAG: hypothetical protein R3C40_09815 [Parvularculaceae bacterium]
MFAMLRRSARSFVLAAMLGGPAVAAAEDGRQASDALAPALLSACDARAARYEELDPALAAAAQALIALAVFTPDDFAGVKAGFCTLRAHGGPVATTACAEDTMLFDEKYRADDQRLPLAATFAHEMKHRAQHAGLRARYGAGYCRSDQYRSDRAALEREADAFGDAVGALLFLGRAVEIRNDCAAVMSVYLEAERPASAPAHIGPVDVAPGAAAPTALHATAGAFKVYAHAESGAPVWAGGRSGGERWMIDGKAVPVRSLDLPAAVPASGPFVLRLACS